MSATIAQPKLIHIKPRKGAKVVGNQHFSGLLKGKSGKEYRYMGNKRLSVPGTGMVLDLSKELDQMYYDILTGPSCRARFDKNAGTMHRFDWIDLDKDAETYLKNEDLRTDYKIAVKELKPHQLRTIGFFFKIGGSLDNIKASLYRLIDSDATRASVGKFLLHSERTMLEYIYHGLKVGDRANQKGLYKNDSQIFMFNDTPIGMTEDAVLAYLRSDDETATQIRNILKQLYEDAAKEQ